MHTTTPTPPRRGNPLRIAVWGSAAALLLLPAVAMQFTREVAWDAADFMLMGALLTGACAAYELATRLSSSTAYRAAAGLAVLNALLLVWINLAVGFIGDEGSRANLMYAGVLAVAGIGAALARLRAAGLSVAMLFTALAQAVVAAVAWSGGYTDSALLTLAFALPWIAAAGLFWFAAQRRAR